MSTAIPSQAEIEAYIGYRLIDTCIFFIIFETLCVGLRIASRRLTKTPLGIDDILIIPAFLLCVSVCGVGIAMVKYGGCGRHADALAYTDPEKLVTLSKLIIALTCVYLWSATLPKLVILALYLRIFTTNFHRRIIYGLGGIIIANLVANFIVGLNQCTPFAYNWDTSIPGGHCVNRVAYFEFASLANILTDLAMLAMPLRIVWKLHTDKATKLGLSAIFLTGSIGLITSIIRFSAFSAEDVFTDISWATVDLTIWTLVEPGTYLIAGCLPTFRPLILWAMGRNPDSQAPSKQTPMSASTARRARIWLDRVFERTERLRDEDDDSKHNHRNNNNNSSTTVTANNLSFTKPKGSQYSAHAESAASPEPPVTDSRGGAIHVEHELTVYSSSELK